MDLSDKKKLQGLLEGRPPHEVLADITPAQVGKLCRGFTEKLLLESGLSVEQALLILDLTKGYVKRGTISFNEAGTAALRIR